ncbi:MAG TPA: hypothetical protein VGN17_16215 [Bryobacteraceae bacterium]|jgi:hypothetical protein
MADTDLPGLASDALARIEEARRRGTDFIAAARKEGNRLIEFAAKCAIGSDSELPHQARVQADALVVGAIDRSLLSYFNVMTYENFVVTPEQSDFETLLPTLDARARRDFPISSLWLEAQRRAWGVRALGRTTLQRATGVPVMPPSGGMFNPNLRLWNVRTSTRCQGMGGGASMARLP